MRCRLAEKEMTMVVDGLLCGLVGRIVARLEENCKRLWGDEERLSQSGLGLASLKNLRAFYQLYFRIVPHGAAFMVYCST